VIEMAMEFDDSLALVSGRLGTARASRAGFAALGETHFPLNVEMALKSLRWRGRHREHAGARVLPRTL
jgi:hypothetical protein